MVAVAAHKRRGRSTALRSLSHLRLKLLILHLLAHVLHTLDPLIDGELAVSIAKLLVEVLEALPKECVALAAVLEVFKLRRARREQM